MLFLPLLGQRSTTEPYQQPLSSLRQSLARVAQPGRSCSAGSVVLHPRPEAILQNSVPVGQVTFLWPFTQSPRGCPKRCF